MAARTIFRESAIDAYRRRAEQDVVPRLISTPVVVCFWVLLGTLLAATGVAWSVRVPTYVVSSGVIAGRDERHATSETAAVLFIAPDRSARMRIGQPVHAEIGSSRTYVQGAVAAVEPGLIGPDAARSRYHAGSGLITEPSVVVIARLARPLSQTAYAGSRLTARVQIGSERLLALVPFLGQLVRGEP